MKHRVIDRYWGSKNEMLADMAELLDTVDGAGIMCSNMRDLFVYGEVAHQQVMLEWHAQNGKLVEFTA